MAQDKKDTSTITISISNELISRFDQWRNAQPYSPSRSKVFAEIIYKFLNSIDKDHSSMESSEDKKVIPMEDKKTKAKPTVSA
jgi:metal-responsive CopG/Arc/MetJ family transcriptional regulator